MELEAVSELVPRFLADRNVPCPQCQYELCDLRSDRCPECGHQLELGLVGEVPLSKVWLTGAIGLSAALGGLLTTSLIVVVLTIVLPRGSEILPWQGGYTIGAFVLLTPLLRMWFAWRLAFGRRSKFVQWFLVTMCLLATPLNLVGNYLFIIVVGSFI